LVKIKVAHQASDGVNGAPRITADLREAGEVVSVKTVAKIMRGNEIRGISPRPWRPVTTIPDTATHHLPDLVEGCFDQGYLATGQGWLYLAAVRDGCSRRVIGYAFADSLHTDLVEQALRRAVLFRDDPHWAPAGVIFHADRGSTPQPSSPGLPTSSGSGYQSGGPACAGTTPNKNRSGPH